MAKMIYDSAPDPVSTPDEMENVSSTSESKIKKQNDKSSDSSLAFFRPSLYQPCSRILFTPTHDDDGETKGDVFFGVQDKIFNGIKLLLSKIDIISNLL